MRVFSQTIQDNKDLSDKKWREGDNGGEIRKRGKQRNTYRRLMGTDNGGIDCESMGNGVGVSKGEKGRTTVTEKKIN